MSRQDDIKKLINNYSRRLQKLNEQLALEGLSVDPKILIEIEDIEAQIKKLRIELKTIEGGIESTSHTNITTSSDVHEKPQRANITSTQLRTENDPSMIKQIEQPFIPPIDFLIITPLEEERDAILNKLPGYEKVRPSDDDVRVYFSSILPVTFPDGSTGAYSTIVMSLLDMGRVQATVATSDAIRRWNPRYVILVGIAGGVAANKVKLGDVLIPNEIVDYELQKQTAVGVDIRWKVYNVSPRLLGAAKNFIDESWLKTIQVKRPRRGQPKCHINSMTSGDKVIDFAQALDKYQETWSKLIGVEMEAGGAAVSAFQAAKQTEFFMIRGVSDLADGDKNSLQVKKWRPYACDVAASYTIALLQSGPIPLITTARRFDKPTPPTKYNIEPYEPALYLWEEGVCTKKFTLRLEAIHFIGRAGVCQFQIDGKYEAVSRRHARIKRTRDKVIILDGDGATSSRGGTFVNGVLVDSKQGKVLDDNDQIILGGFKDAERRLIADGACLLTFERQTPISGK